MSRFHDPAGALRPATLSLAGLAIASVAVAAIALNAGRPTAPSGAATASQSVPSASAAAVEPTPVPTAVATPVATPKPTTTPETDPGQDAIPLTVKLATVDGHAVTVDIVDRTGSIVSAVSGQPAEGASAEGLSVVNIDARTLRLTWVDFPIANRDALFVDAANGKLRMLLVQPAPTTTTDAIGFDRVLILTFDRPVDAGSVQTTIQEGIDTAG